MPLGRIDPLDWIKLIGPRRRALLDTLLKEGSAAQAVLPAKLGLSQPSFARLVNNFVADGVLTTSSRAPTGRGNPSVMLHLAPDHAFGIGAGIVGDALSIALVDIAGTVRGTRRVVLEDRSRAAIVAHIRRERDDLVAAARVDPAHLVGAGVGFGGFLVDGPLRFNPPAVLADWVDADVPAIMQDAFELPVLCDNDATTATIAESLLGVGRTCPTFAFCHLTNDFGGALIVDGRPMRGSLGNAGDFGGVWWLLDQGYPNLERLRAHVEEGGKPFGSVEITVERLTADMPGIEGWLAEAERPFASLAFLLGHMVSPDKVMIGGRLPGWLAARITLPASPPRNDQPFRLPGIVARQVDGDAVAIGAALMPLQALFFA